MLLLHISKKDPWDWYIYLYIYHKKQANVDPWMVWVLSKKKSYYLLFYMGKSRKIKPVSLIQLDVHFVETRHGWFMAVGLEAGCTKWFSS